jgi:hypothetical protein
MELAAAPMALFLDEPTSGLDATSASSIMMTLKVLSHLGITVVAIIHQPRQEIFESLDSLLLFAAGRMIYSGRGDKVQRYFENIGFHFPVHGNPADALMDIIAGQGQIYKKSGDTGIKQLIEHWKNSQPDKIEGVDPVSMDEHRALRTTLGTRGAPFGRQLHHCFCRAMVQQSREWLSLWNEVGLGALAGFLVALPQFSASGGLFRGSFYPPYDVLSSSMDFTTVLQTALLAGLAIGLTASSPAVKTFSEEKLVFWREAASGHNRFAYYLGKILATIPRMILANLHFTVFLHLPAMQKISFAESFAANLLYFYCIYGLAFCISMVTRREEAPLLAVMSSLIVGVLDGLAPSLCTVAKWHLLWFWYICPGTWLAEGYFTQNVEPLRYLYQIDAAAEELGYTLNRFQVDMLMLLALGTIYRVLAFLGLRFLNRSRQK